MKFHIRVWRLKILCGNWQEKNVLLYKKTWTQSTDHPSDFDDRDPVRAILFCPGRVSRRCQSIPGGNGSGHAGCNEEIIPSSELKIED